MKKGFFTYYFSSLILHLSDTGLLNKIEAESIIEDFFKGQDIFEFLSENKRKSIKDAFEENTNRIINSKYFGLT
nr:hypothetical protein [uncultured Psychroserpens sp.]